MNDLPLCNMSTLKSLEQEVGAGVLSTLITSLCDEIETSRENFTVYIKNTARQSLEVEAHALKSAALSFGAERLSQTCRSIEFATKDQKDFKYISDLVIEFENEAKALLKHLKHLNNST